ncbi:hypothetical protein BCSJ1_17735 [Bacillus cereus SJ1]|nr:hypothetical protein BCSJ1_17735 [Bacillus cereus SJ1]
MIGFDFIYWKGVILLSYMKEICKKRGVIMKINWTEVKEKFGRKFQNHHMKLGLLILLFI